jgi:adenine-specific DNA methylase
MATATLTTTDYREVKAQAEAEDTAEQVRIQQAATADAQRRAIQAAAERERILDSIDLQPYDAAVWDALDNLSAAATALAAASAQRESAKTQAVETITPFAEHSDRIRLGVVPTLNGYRLTSNRKLEITEICRTLAPLVRSIGRAEEQLTTNALEQRSRAGNRLGRPQKGN